MHLELDDTMKIAVVQEVFNNLFPFLKIEFFEQDIRMNGNIPTRKHISNGNRKLGEFRPKKQKKSELNINISPNMKVTELEETFCCVYSLQTQVFRKSGKVWLETTITDGWSLDEQNKQGEIITEQMSVYRH